MKYHFFAAALLLGAALTANAEGYKDGIEYYKAGQYSNAITILNKNLNNPDTDKAMANYYLGQSYIVKEDLTKAKACFDAGIAADPNNPYNYVGVGYMALLNNNEKLAKENFEKATKLGKKNTEIQVDIARAYFDADALKYAKEVEKYLQKAYKDSKNQDPSIYMFEGDKLARLRDFNGAAAQYEQAITFDNDNPSAYVKYANVYYYVVPEYAIQRLEELLRKQPNSTLAQRELARKYYELGQSTQDAKKAAQYYNKAADKYAEYMKNPNHLAEDEAEYAVLLFADGKYDETIATAKKVLAGDPGNMDLTMDRLIIRSYYNQDKDDEALAASEQYFIKPSYEGRYNVGDYTTYADLLNTKGQYEKAVEILERGRKQLPNEPVLVSRLASTLSQQEKNVDAMNAYIEYMNMLQSPTTQDYNRGSQYANYALYDVEGNADLTNKYGQIGLEYIDKMNATDNPSVMLRRAQIMQQLNNDVITDEIASAYKNVVSMLDANSDYANPASKSNQLRTYVIAYGNLYNYYAKKGMKAEASDANTNLKKYTDLRNQIQ